METVVKTNGEVKQPVNRVKKVLGKTVAQAVQAAGHFATKEVSIPQITLQRMTVTLRSREGSSVIVHRFSKKDAESMLAKQTGKAKAKKAPRDIKAEYEGCFYDKSARGKHQVPTIWFKKAAINAAHTFVDFERTKAKGAFFVLGDYVEIEGKPHMREDTVRLDSGVAMQRFRPAFDTWSVTLKIEFNPNIISDAQLIHLLEMAGFSVGVGDWRPEKTGDHGRFFVDKTSIKIEAV